MNIDYIQTLADETIFTIAVQFPETTSKLYTYKTRDTSIEVGDLVVVPTSRHGVDQFHVVEVVEVHDTPQINPDSQRKYKWVVNKVDQEAHSDFTTIDYYFEKQLRKKERESHRKQAQEVIKEIYGEDLKQLLDLKHNPDNTSD